MSLLHLGTALLVLRGTPGVRGLTIDTAAETDENPVIDEWAQNDVSLKNLFLEYAINKMYSQGISSPHDMAVSQRGDAVYVAEVPQDRKNIKIHKYDVINNSPDQ